MGNSPLATYRHNDADTYGVRDHKIDTISPHCFVAQVTGKRGADALNERKDKASANYVVGYDGSIAVNLDEHLASICTSNRANDMRAVTIEVASDSKHPYKVTDAALNSLIKLLVDVCQRNGIKELKWSDSKADRMGHLNGCNMTVHRDFANKACPGDYLMGKMPYIADEVNKLLKEDKPMTDYEKEFAKAIELGITDGTNPDAPCTRRQAAVMVLRAVKLVLSLIGKVEV